MQCCGSGEGFFLIPDHGSRILNPNFCELSDNFPFILCHVWIRDSGLVKIRIRGSVDKYPGSATLVLCY